MQYIRPGAAPLPGDPAAGALGLPGAGRPSLVSGPTATHGRGDWRPASGRGIPGASKSYHTNFGFPAWANGSARATGSGLDFTLPSHKSDGFWQVVHPCFRTSMVRSESKVRF
ncbi:hypothetical protein GW17_00051188 [Ensete ventricosum]|nr:hypothetical protein GW17_00051188 [Ensete ventricosum]